MQIEVWATFDYYRDHWAANPFNPVNNVNYTLETSKLPARVDSHPTQHRNDFFRSVPGAKNLDVVLPFQERFVEKLLSHSLKYNHVLYCMDNETSVTPKWGAYWSDFIRKKAAEQGKTVETTEMWDPWDLAHPMHNATFDHPETYSFVDISQNNHQRGQTHYDNALAQRRRLAERPRPMNNVKIYGADGGRFGNTRDGIERFWRGIFAGCAAVRFHRPDSGIGISDTALRMIRSAREVTDAVDVPRCGAAKRPAERLPAERGVLSGQAGQDLRGLLHRRGQGRPEGRGQAGVARAMVRRRRRPMERDAEDRRRGRSRPGSPAGRPLGRRRARRAVEPTHVRFRNVPISSSHRRAAATAPSVAAALASPNWPSRRLLRTSNSRRAASSYSRRCNPAEFLGHRRIETDTPAVLRRPAFEHRQPEIEAPAGDDRFRSALGQGVVRQVGRPGGQGEPHAAEHRRPLGVDPNRHRRHARREAHARIRRRRVEIGQRDLPLALV